MNVMGFYGCWIDPNVEVIKMVADKWVIFNVVKLFFTLDINMESGVFGTNIWGGDIVCLKLWLCRKTRAAER